MKKMITPFSVMLAIIATLASCTKKAGNPEAEALLTPETALVANTTLNSLSFIDNDAVWLDVDGNEIKAQGGWILEEDGTYHWFGPQFGNSGDYKFYAINHYTSDDLQNWTKQSPAIAPGMSGVPMNANSWVGRPWVLKNPNHNNYVMGLEWGSSGVAGVRNQYVFFTATSINGPWTYHADKRIQKMADINGTLYSLGDMGVYSEGNDAWIMYTFDKPQANYSQAIIKLDDDFMTPLAHSVTGAYTEFTGQGWQAGVQEAAAIFKRGGTYYYFTSLCNSWNSSVTRYRTASSMQGPWTANAIVPTSPSSTNSFNTQHDFILPVTGTAGTTFIYCGDRWSNYTGSGTGRYGWYPLTFDGSGVPTINAPSYAANGGDWVLNLATGEWSVPSANLLQNPGFESDFSNWTYSGNASIATATPEVHSGTKAVKSWSSSAYTTSLQNASATNCAAGSYTVSVWSRGSGAFSQRELQVYINNVLTRDTSMSTSTNWTQYSIGNITVPAGADVKIGIALTAGASAWTQFDDFELVKQ